jgi:hypothetical protein
VEKLIKGMAIICTGVRKQKENVTVTLLDVKLGEKKRLIIKR